jgi:predicted permease
MSRKSRLLNALADEMRDHIERDIQERIARGIAPEDAHRQAMIHFGNAVLTAEDTRAVWTWRRLSEVRADLRYALRSLRKSPAFTVTAVITLGLAIGLNTAMFSVVNALLLRPLPYRSPGQLAMLWSEDRTRDYREGRVALWDVGQWRAQSQCFTDLATFDSVSTTLVGLDGAEQIVGASISPNLLPLLGVQPILGRIFSSGEAEQQQRLVLISHRLWQARFGGSRDALGATLVLNGLPFQITGVLPAKFTVARLDAEVWVPHASHATVRGPETWFVVGRLRPAMTFEQAQKEMSAVSHRLSDQLPFAERNRDVRVEPLSLYMVGQRSRLALWILGGAVLCVLLIAAANVTSLSLARSIARTREMAVRAALGASTARIVRQLLTEGMVLAALSGLVGVLLAGFGIPFIRVFGPADLPRLNELGVDVGVLGYAVAISTLAGFLLGLAPAMTILSRGLRLSVEEGGRNVSGGAAARRIRRALVVAEFALAIVLLVGAGLLVRSWQRVTSVDPGFRPERVLAFELAAPASFTAEQRTEMYDRVLEQIQSVPGVQNAGIIGDLFIGNAREQIVTVEREDGMAAERLQFSGDEVSADFFTAVGTPLLRGRFVSSMDGPAAAPVAVVNEAMARRSWPERDPVGRRFKLGPPDSPLPWYTVVGVVANMQRQGPDRASFPQMFVSLAQGPPRNVDVFVRTSSTDPRKMSGPILAAARRVEKTAPLYGVTPFEQSLGNYFAVRRFQTLLLTTFSIVALLMAGVGINGLIQYSISTREQEIGLRLALGAQAGNIFRMIVSEGLRLTLTGLALGLGGAWWLGRAVSSLLFGVTATDPFTFTAASLLLTAVAIGACYFPARRAMRMEPVVALRVA